MAKDLNKVMIIGRLGKDPEARYTSQGTMVTNFSVASGRSWTDSSGEKQEETTWFNVVAWDKLGEICNNYMNKGSRVYIEGRLQTRKWQDNDGNDRYTTEVVASDVILLDSKNGNGNGTPADEAPRQSKPAPVKDKPQTMEDDSDLPF